MPSNRSDDDHKHQARRPSGPVGGLSGVNGLNGQNYEDFLGKLSEKDMVRVLQHRRDDKYEDGTPQKPHQRLSRSRDSHRKDFRPPQSSRQEPSSIKDRSERSHELQPSSEYPSSSSEHPTRGDRPPFYGASMDEPDTSTEDALRKRLNSEKRIGTMHSSQTRGSSLGNHWFSGQHRSSGHRQSTGHHEISGSGYSGHYSFSDGHYSLSLNFSDDADDTLHSGGLKFIGNGRGMAERSTRNSIHSDKGGTSRKAGRSRGPISRHLPSSSYYGESTPRPRSGGTNEAEFVLGPDGWKPRENSAGDFPFNINRVVKKMGIATPDEDGTRNGKIRRFDGFYESDDDDDLYY